MKHETRTDLLKPSHGILRHPLSPDIPQQLLGNDGEDILEPFPSGSLVSHGGAVRSGHCGEVGIKVMKKGEDK